MITRIEELLFQLEEGNTLQDDRSSLDYAVVNRIVNSLDEVFKQQGFLKIQCIYIAFQNDIDHAVVILYLLSRKINFYLRSNTGHHQQIPPFCDVLLTWTAEGATGVELSERLELKRNSDCTGSEFIRPGSGKVFFSSSGSTGLPKFIMHTSASLLLNAQAVAERFKYGPEKKVLIPVPVNHMYGFGVGFLPSVMTGASIRLVDKNNVIKLFENLNSFQPDITLLTPPVCKMLVLLNKTVPGNSLYISAGDKMKSSTYAAFESRYGMLINLYGCTELGAIATSHEKMTGEERTEGVVRPLSNVRIIIEGDGKGEVLCRHPAAFEGYIDSNGKEIPLAEKKWFRTKDLGTRTGHKKFKVLGRTDHSINRLGYLVSFREIEFALEELFTEIQEVIVVQDANENMLGDRLIAYCQTEGPQALNKDAIKKICREKIPRHLIPDDFIFVAALPRLTNGKPDRQLLHKNNNN
ncbi:MAG TPA: class I adenylate-forming enzyme family protein [Puia sp.]|nr:class I adenylate-forming enzyme family protein [Puia sp.]